MLLKLKVDQLKRAFNDHFREFCEAKQSDIYRLEEKADRLQEIYTELRYDGYLS